MGHPHHVYLLQSHLARPDVPRFPADVDRDFVEEALALRLLTRYLNPRSRDHGTG